MIVHATTVVLEGRGVMIIGASGTGKSSLGLRLMALGAVLVADDRTVLKREGHRVFASAPDRLFGLIEARGVGILRADASPEAPVHLVVDLDHLEVDRLPVPKVHAVLDTKVPCLHKSDTPAWPAAIVQYLKAGTAEV